MTHLPLLLPLLRPHDADYADRLEALVRRHLVVPPEVDAAARAIVEDVRARGDAAIRDLTERFEGRRLAELELSPARWRAEADRAAPDVVAALQRAAERIRAFHAPQRESGYEHEEGGVRLGLRVEPLASVGLYVPGGSARYPSSVLMTAIPARLAGVRDLVMATPGASPETLAAARLAGVDRVFEIGGAQAVAALAYGTESVPRVDKIVGPGDAWVAAAKRLVFGEVDVDATAGPSEILVIADETARPSAVAADLLAQTEHDAEARAVLLATSEALAVEVATAVSAQAASLPRRAIAEAALRRHGAAVVVADVAAAVRLANRIAPAHLELHVRDARRVAERIRTAGAILVGPFTTGAAGNTVAGPNHVLPTGGAARYASPLGVYDFVKRLSVLEYTEEALSAHAADVTVLARAEGLEAHARSVELRLEAPARRP